MGRKHDPCSLVWPICLFVVYNVVFIVMLLRLHLTVTVMSITQSVNQSFTYYAAVPFSIVARLFAAILIGCNHEFFQSVHPSVVYRLLTRKQKKTYNYELK